MRAKKDKIAIIGAGIIGLTTALEAQGVGYRDVTIYSDKKPLQTTSAKAGAVFEPYRPGNMGTQEMLSYLKVGLKKYEEIITKNSESRTGMRHHDHYSTSTKLLVPSEISFLPAFDKWKLITSSNIPGGYKSAIFFESIPFVDPTKALPWLLRKFIKAGGKIKYLKHKIDDLEKFVKEIPQNIIFNCTGLGAKKLLDDKELRPMRGQIIIINNKFHDWSVLGDDGFYVFPRRTETILGGTTEIDEWEEETTAGAMERIFTNAKRVIPKLRKKDILRVYAGLRPYRASGAKIALNKVSGKKHVQSIGFGGSGWTFCWGAAERAVLLAVDN